MGLPLSMGREMRTRAIPRTREWQKAWRLKQKEKGLCSPRPRLCSKRVGSLSVEMFFVRWSCQPSVVISLQLRDRSILPVSCLPLLLLRTNPACLQHGKRPVALGAKV